MKLIVILFLIFGAIAQTSKCEKETTALNQEMKLKYKQSIQIKEENLKITFVAVSEDSRCPQGEQCIRAGNASVTLELAKGNSSPVTITLNTSNEPQEYIYLGVAIRLIDLQPHPKSGVDLEPENYIASLKIYKQTDQNSKGTETSQNKETGSISK